MMSSSVTVLVILSLGVLAAHAATTGADVDRHVCENILRSNEEIQRRGGSRIGEEEADPSGAGNGFARPGAWRRFSSVRGGGDSGSFETRYSTREHGPYTVGTGYAKVSLDDPTSSPLMSNLIRRYVNTDSVWNDPGRQTTGLITAQIHFPRELMTAENSDVQLPVIVLAPPLQVAAEFIAALFTTDFFEFVLEYFASHGYITITTTEVSSREWNDFAEIKIGHRVIDLLKFVESQSNTEGSWLYGKYNGYAGVYGVSMGGGAGLYVSTIPDSGIAAAALMVPSYFAADPEDDRGGFGAYTTADLKVPVLVTGADPQTDFLIDNPVSSYFEESSTPIAAFTLRGTSHFSMTHVRFGLPYMNAFFSLHLKNNNAETGGGRSPGYDVKAAETVYGDGPGSIIRNGSVRQSDSEINTRTRAAALPDGLLEVANLRERDTTLCVVEDVRGVGLRLLDTVRLDAGDADVIDVNTENGDVEDGRRKILLIDQDDYTTTFVRF